jgi:hypothetical protein
MIAMSFIGLPLGDVIALVSLPRKVLELIFDVTSSVEDQMQQQIHNDSMSVSEEAPLFFAA